MRQVLRPNLELGGLALESLGVARRLELHLRQLHVVLRTLVVDLVQQALLERLPRAFEVALRALQAHLREFDRAGVARVALPGRDAGAAERDVQRFERALLLREPAAQLGTLDRGEHLASCHRVARLHPQRHDAAVAANSVGALADTMRPSAEASRTRLPTRDRSDLHARRVHRRDPPRPAAGTRATRTRRRRRAARTRPAPSQARRDSPPRATVRSIEEVPEITAGSSKRECHARNGRNLGANAQSAHVPVRGTDVRRTRTDVRGKDKDGGRRTEVRS